SRRPAVRTDFASSFETLEDRSLPSTFMVTSLVDRVPGSLRQAVLDANANPGADTIHFDKKLSGRIGLTGGELVITGDLTIDGPGADKITVSGKGTIRVMRIDGVTVEISGLTIADGRADKGGGIWNAGGRLRLGGVVVSGNEARGATGSAFGGGLL